MSIFSRLFKKPREFELNGAERRGNVRYIYHTHLKTGERRVMSEGLPVDFEAWGPKETKIIDLRNSAKGKGDAWLQSKEVRSRSE